jgi:hypothetical protein
LIISIGQLHAAPIGSWPTSGWLLLGVNDRFRGYRQKSGGISDATARPKIAHFKLVEWNVIPDAVMVSLNLQCVGARMNWNSRP